MAEIGMERPTAQSSATPQVGDVCAVSRLSDYSEGARASAAQVIPQPRPVPGTGATAAVRRVLEDAWWYTWARGAQGGTALVASIALSHILQPDQYGLYAVAMAVSTLGGTILFNWISSSAFRFYAEAEADGTHGVLMAASVWALVLSTAATIVVLAVAVVVTLVLDSALSIRLLVPIAGVAITEAVLTLYKSVLMARREVRTLSGLVAVECLLRWGGAIGAAVVAAPRTDLLLYGQLTGTALLAVALAVRSARALTGAMLQHPPWEYVRRMFVFGAPLAGSSLSSWVISVSDRILLAGLAGSTAAGVYAAGYQIGSNIVLLPASVLMAGAYPVLLQEYGTVGRDAASRMLSTLTSAAVVAGTAVVVAIVSAAPLLASVLGPAFRQSSGIIPLIAGAQLLAVITEYYAKSFQLTNRTGRLFQVSALAAVVSVVANLALVPWMRMYGSAAATLIASGAALTLTVRWGRPLLPFDLERTLALKVGAAAAVSIAAARLLPPVVDVASLRALATLIPMLAFGACLVAARENTTIAALRFCTGRQPR